jgi:hypothetical protein
MKINGVVNVNGGKLTGVVTLDSPLGGIDPGITAISAYFARQFFQEMDKCPALTSLSSPILDDLFRIYGGGTPHGGKARGVMLVVNGGDFSNQEIAAEAARNNVHVITMGYVRDFVYNPTACPSPVGAQVPGYTNFTSTQ